MGLIYDYSDMMTKVRGGVSRFEETKEIVRVAFIGLRGVLTLGALIFLWQVRHPKTE